MKNMSINHILIFTILLFGVSVYAQDLPKTAQLFVAHEKNIIETDTNLWGSSEIEYDVYGRAIRIDSDFPLGYTATTSVSYFPLAYLTKDKGEWGYEPKEREESGELFLQGESIVNYKVTFNESGEVISRENEGAEKVRLMAYVVSAFLGTFIDVDARAWFENRFGEEL